MEIEIKIGVPEKTFENEYGEGHTLIPAGIYEVTRINFMRYVIEIHVPDTYAEYYEYSFCECHLAKMLLSE